MILANNYILLVTFGNQFVVALLALIKKRFGPSFGVINFLVGGQYFCYDWCWGTVHSEGTCEQNISTVAVIDGGLYIEKYSVPQCQMQTSLI